MKKIQLLLLLAVLAAPLFSQNIKLQDSDFYTTTTQMRGNGYTLDFKETGEFTKNPSQGDGYILDPDPYGVRDFIPPSRPEGLKGVALDSTTIRLTWQASIDNIRVTGYHIYRNGAAVGFSPEESFTDTGLAPMTFYRYTVQAVDKGMNLSPMSDPVYVTTLDTTAQSRAPRFISGPSVRYTSGTMAVIGFATDKAVTAVVEYGTTPAYGQSVSGSDYATDQLVILTDLSPGTGYHYRVLLSDYSGHGPVASRDDTFHTSWTMDSTAPRFVEWPCVDYVSDTIATITFRTDEDALATIRYGKHSVSENSVAETDYTADHALTLTDLTPNTCYTFEVSVIDRSGNGPTKTRACWFKTKTEPDTRAPLITRKPKTAYLSDTMAIIVWETDEVADSVVKFDTEKDTCNRQAASVVMSRHHMVILTGLAAHTMYYYNITSTDPSGNKVEGSHDEYHFITDRTPDRKSPKIRKVEIKAQATCAVITWETDELAESKILYGLKSDQHLSQAYDWLLKENHMLVLTALEPGKEYYCQIFAKDPAGNQSETFELRFCTDKTNHNGCDLFDRCSNNQENKDK